MALKDFFKKAGDSQKQEEELLLWKAGQSEAGIIKDRDTGSTYVFNMPVSPLALPGKGKIIAVQSSTEGDGATTIAVNLAGLLASSGPERVVIADLAGYGAVRARMGIPTGECLTNMLDWEDIHCPGDIPRGLFAHSSGVMVIPGVIHYDHVDKITPDLIFKTLTLLKESFDYIIIDCPPASTGNNAWAGIVVSDVVLTVFRPDRASIDLLGENSLFMIRLGCENRVHTVLNQAGIPGGIRAGDIEKIPGLGIISTLPYSPGVTEENNRRQLVVLSRHKDDFSRAMQLLADNIPDPERPLENAGMDRELMKRLALRFGGYFIKEEEEDYTDPGLDQISQKIPGLNEEKYIEIRGYVQKTLSSLLKPEEKTRSRDPIVRSKLKSIVLRGLLEKSVPLGEAASQRLVEELGNDLLGYGPIEPFFYDPEVTEIKAGRNVIRIEKSGQEIVVEGVNFRGEDHIKDVLERMLAPTGRKIDMATPRVNARLTDGSRLIAHMSPVAVDGTMFTIRRFRKDMTVENLIVRKVISTEVMEFIRAAVGSRMNMVISGGTGSGKTTFLNCTASFIAENQSIITIEDPAELQLQHPNVRRLEARPATAEHEEITQRELVKDALRMRPDRIIVGEVRGAEAFDMLQAMNTGHQGSETTGHANSARHCTKRLVNMVQMAGMDIPYDGIVEQISDAVDIFIHVLKDKTGRRRMDHICEVAGVQRIEGVLNVRLNTLWQYNYKTDNFDWVADSFNRQDIFRDGGWGA
ncbi:MAG: ATPase, T2SS/T4P/T4SS family [Desulfocucumaceae bacterium]